MNRKINYKTKAQFLRDFRRFIRLENDPRYYIRENEEYTGKFTNGETKAEEVVDYITRNNVECSRLAILEIGPGAYSPAIKLMDSKGFNYGILVESLPEFCKQLAEQKKVLPAHKDLRIIEGDAYGAIAKIREYLFPLIQEGKIDGIMVIGFSVFHELFRRSPNADATTFQELIQEFLIQVTEGLDEVHFYCKEPCNFHEWSGQVAVSLHNWLKPEELKQFCKIIQKRLGKNNSKEFNKEVFMMGDFVKMDASLATEITKKLLYFLYDQSVDNLIYETQECHSEFDPAKLRRAIEHLLTPSSKNRGRVAHDIMYRTTTSDTFFRLFQESGIEVKSTEDKFVTGIIPKGFVCLEAYRKPAKKKKENARNNGRSGCRTGILPKC